MNKMLPCTYKKQNIKKYGRKTEMVMKNYHFSLLEFTMIIVQCMYKHVTVVYINVDVHIMYILIITT